MFLAHLQHQVAVVQVPAQLPVAVPAVPLKVAVLQVVVVLTPTIPESQVS